MTVILILRYNLRQTMINKHMSVLVPKLCKKHKLSISERQNNKKEVVFTFLIAILFSVNFRVNVAAILDCFFQNLLVSNVYSWSTKSLQISRIIHGMFSGIIIVTVGLNIKKRRTY